MRAPRPSSQALVGSEKNAHGAFVCVSQRDRPKDATAMTDAAIPIRRPASPRLRAINRTIAGQNR